jgi:hypothetical protein
LGWERTQVERRSEVTYDFVLDKLAKKRPKITLLDRKTVLIEGNAISLKYLGYLLLAHTEASDCGDQWSPDGAGSQLFSKNSTLALYLHTLPCKAHKPKDPRKKLN